MTVPSAISADHQCKWHHEYKLAEPARCQHTVIDTYLMHRSRYELNKCLQEIEPSGHRRDLKVSQDIMAQSTKLASCQNSHCDLEKSYNSGGGPSMSEATGDWLSPPYLI